MAVAINVEFWERLTDLSNKQSDMAGKSLNTIMKSTNQTSGIHIYQWITNVELTEDGSMKRSMRVGFDGKDYISLEPDRMRWVATNHFAVMIKEDWDSDESWNKYWEWSMKVVGVQNLKRYFEAGKEYFQRKEIPENSAGHSHLGMIFGLVAALAALLLIIGIIIWKRQQRDSPSVTYTTAQRHSQSLIDE